MYETFYGFAGRPFQLTPDPQFYFESATHRKAMSYLGYGLAQGEGFIVITGDIGAGKTTLVGHLMATIDPQRLIAAKIVSTQVGGDDMLRLAAQALGIETDNAEKAQILGRVEAFLHHQAREGRRALLIVDEAQNMSGNALEELRMLSNFQLGGQALLQIFLLGQPEFRERISGSQGFEQLRQRIIATHHLAPMQFEEVGPYIEHRLKVVGWTGNPHFTEDAFDMLADASGCVPRRLNALLSRVLLAGSVEHLSTIDGRLVESVVANLRDDIAPFEPEQDAAEPIAPRHEPEVRSPEPVGAEPATMQRAVQSGIHSLRTLHAEVDALHAAMAADHREDELAEDEREEPVAETAQTLDADALSDIEARLAKVEERLDEQDEVLRRILSKLIEWVERDARNGPFTRKIA